MTKTSLQAIKGGSLMVVQFVWIVKL